jgi:hypothetical protein
MTSDVSLKAIKEQFPGYCERIKTRLEVGARTYGDKSFSREPVELLEEIQQEIDDISGWAFVLHCRVKAIIDSLQRKD